MRAVFLDIETTGLDQTRHVPIDIAFIILDVTTGQEIKRYESVIKYSVDTWNQRDLGSVAINGFTWEEIQKGKDPEIVTSEIVQAFKEADVKRLKSVFICQNPAFDRGFFTQLIDVYTQEKLNWPYHWLDFASMYWALLAKENAEKGMAFPEELNLSKNEIAKRRGLPPEQEPHRAIRGVEHLIACYKEVVGLKVPSQSINNSASLSDS